MLRIEPFVRVTTQKGETSVFSQSSQNISHSMTEHFHCPSLLHRFGGTKQVAAEDGFLRKQVLTIARCTGAIPVA